MTARTEPQSLEQIAQRLRLVSMELVDIGVQMEYYGGFNMVLAARGRELVSAGVMAHDWGEQIDVFQKEAQV